MRMRSKKWARPELADCPYYHDDPLAHKGHWSELFPRRQPVYMELGCGKGGFLAEWAISHPEVNFVGVDLISDMLGVARRNIQSAFDGVGRPVDNLLLTAFDITRIDLYWNAADPVDRIFINFCNPWFRPKQYKKRLTHPRQLLHYRDFLRDGGELWFKTDSDLLFAHSLPYFEECGFGLIYQTQDLHSSGFAENVPTEHERMYTAEGIPTKFLIARKLPGDFGTPVKTPEKKAENRGDFCENSIDKAE